jgi:hypothetical protein
LKFGFARIHLRDIWTRLTTENILAAKVISEFQGVIGENPSPLVRSEFKV